MSRHQPRYLGSMPGEIGVACTCRAFKALDLPTRQQAEDEFAKHMREVEKLRARVSGYQPSLKTTYAYYREMQTDPDQTPEEQALWKQMADEMASRVGRDVDPEDQPALPFD